jgi:hypothetical protein
LADYFARGVPEGRLSHRAGLMPRVAGPLQALNWFPWCDCRNERPTSPRDAGDNGRNFRGVQLWLLTPIPRDGVLTALPGTAALLGLNPIPHAQIRSEGRQIAEWESRSARWSPASSLGIPLSSGMIPSESITLQGSSASPKAHRTQNCAFT